MLEAAGRQSSEASKNYSCDREQRRKTLEAKKKVKWGGVFAELGGKATTTRIAGHMGRSSGSVIKSMHDLEVIGWVRRFGTIPKTKGNGIPQIIWQWML